MKNQGTIFTLWTLYATWRSGITHFNSIRFLSQLFVSPESLPCFSCINCFSLDLCAQVLCNPSQPPGLQPARLLCPWDSPGESIGMGCHDLLWGPSQPGDQVHASCLAGGLSANEPPGSPQDTIHWARAHPHDLTVTRSPPQRRCFRRRLHSEVLGARTSTCGLGEGDTVNP